MTHGTERAECGPTGCEATKFDGHEPEARAIKNKLVEEGVVSPWDLHIDLVPDGHGGVGVTLVTFGPGQKLMRAAFMEAGWSVRDL